MVYHWSFFTAFDQGRIVLFCLGDALLMGGVGPLTHQRDAELMELFNQHLLGLVGIHAGGHFFFKVVQ